MGTTNLTGGAAAAKPYSGLNRHFQIKSPLITLPAAAVTNDILEVLPVKEGWLVKGTRAEIVVQGAGTTITLDIGITGGTVDGFDAAIDGKTAAGSVLLSTPSDTYPAAGGFYVTADDTIDIKCKAISSMTTPTQLYVYADVEDLNAA